MSPTGAGGGEWIAAFAQWESFFWLQLVRAAMTGFLVPERLWTGDQELAAPPAELLDGWRNVVVRSR